MAGVEGNGDDFFNGLDEHKRKLEAALLAYGKTAAHSMEGYAKTHRPWVDRTGNARNSIFGDAAVVKDGVDVYISGNTEYFVQLELDHEKQYAILWPTIEAKREEILKGLAGLF